MKITTLEAFSIDPAQVHVNEHGCINPFHQDLWNMGTRLGTNVTLMHSNFDNAECASFVIVNTRTGERFKIEMETKCVKCGKVGHEQVHSMKFGGMVCESCYNLTENDHDLPDQNQCPQSEVH